MKKRVSRLFALLLMISAGSALAGGDWKMGPFGPYWDDNSWPEFTPMYWMEEFMNRLDDDDDEIRDWMLRNQFPGQFPGTGLPGGYPLSGSNPLSGWNMPGAIPQNSWQPNAWNNPWNNPMANPMGNPFTMPHGNVPGNDWGNDWIDRDSWSSWRSPYSERGRLPRLTREEFARMPGDVQREYTRAFERAYSEPSRRSPYRERRSLPNLTREEFSRMPRDVQREYKRAFDREYSEYQTRQARERYARMRRNYP